MKNKEEPNNELVKNFVFLSNERKKNSTQEVAKQEETIQEPKQEEATNATADASEEAKQEEVYQEIIDISTDQEAIEFKILDKNSTQEVVKQEESIQENKQEAIEYSFKYYLKSIIAIENLVTQESDDSISFNFTIKKADLIAFKQPKVYTSYEHSLKIKKGQENARKEGRTPGVKRGAKRERKDKKPLIDQIKKLSKSFNGDMNNHELAKKLHCSLNRICAYKREIKQQLKNTN